MLLRPSRAGQRSGWPILCTAVRTELTTSRVTGHSCLLTQLRMIRVPCHGRCPPSSAPGRCCCEIVPASGHGTITKRCRSPKTGTQAAGRLLRSFVLEPFVWVSMLMSIGWRRFFCFLLIFDSIFISVVPRNLQDSNGKIGKSKVCASVCVQLRACVLSHAHLMPSHAHLHLQPRFPSIELVLSAGRAVRPFGITRGAENNEAILGSKKLKTLAPLALQAGSHHR